MLIYANPFTHSKAKSQGGTMATKKRKWGSPAQKAALRKMLAARKHHNPSTAKKRSGHSYHAKKKHRNPFTVSRAGISGKLTLKNGAMLILGAGGGLVIPEVLASKMPPQMQLNPWARLATKAAIGGLGWWGLKRVNPYLALGFLGGALGSVVVDGIRYFRVTQAIPAAHQDLALAKTLADNPAAFEAALAANRSASLAGYGGTRALAGYGGTRALADGGPLTGMVRSMPPRYAN